MAQDYTRMFSEWENTGTKEGNEALRTQLIEAHSLGMEKLKERPLPDPRKVIRMCDDRRSRDPEAADMIALLALHYSVATIECKLLRMVVDTLLEEHKQTAMNIDKLKEFVDNAIEDMAEEMERRKKEGKQ